MKTRQVGNTDLHFTVIGLGTWAMGGGGWKWGWGPQDDDASIAAIHRAVEQGINWVDTAPIYGFGRAEEVVGKALRGLTPRPLVATKCSRVWDEQHNVSGNLEERSLRLELERSLRLLQAEVIDLYFMHYPLPEQDMERGWETLSRFKREGKVRQIGVSNIGLEHLKRLQAIEPVACIQPPYSLLERGIEKEIIPYCRAQGIGIVAYSPLQRGLLTGQFSKERIESLPEDDHRKRDKHFVEPAGSVNLQLVEGLRALAARRSTRPCREPIGCSRPRTS
ncbi:MAG: aldo/keto reductase [Candidatus Eisenbacteria bacterium]|nr:aldo/keto reductase [Candidatus Eisenbacteria bacterium]